MATYIDWEIISKSLNDSLSTEEQQTLDQWLAESPSHRKFYEDAIAGGATNPEIGVDYRTLKYRKEQLFRLINSQQSQRKKQIARWIGYAAFFALLVGFTLLFRSENDYRENQESVSLSEIPGLLPGCNKAMLTLADGRQVALDSVDQEVVSLDGSRIQNRNNTLIYSDSKSTVPVYNIITIPRGGEYQLVLSDGSKVWINSCTEIKYPVAFSPEDRTIYMKGEAYFEIAKDKRPFNVIVDDLQVKVYGTHFNINAYSERVIETTLIEGSVGLYKIGQTKGVLLKPSEQACYRISDSKIAVHKVNGYDFIAWKNGEFVFNDQTIEEIMTRLSVWYDIQVIYENNEIRHKKFTGVIQRYTTIDKILHYIEETATISFTANGRVIRVK